MHNWQIEFIITKKGGRVKKRKNVYGGYRCGEDVGA
jgi:hypothetical protein